jgi:hypothetical protein
MKFLCVPCDTPMKLQTLAPPDRGSLSVVYACPECGYEIAMLTNAYETQVVQSLGVRIGPGLRADSSDDAQRAAGASAGYADGAVERESAAAVAGEAAAARAGCPFAGMVSTTERAPDPVAIRWTSAAEARLANIPSFVRPMARTGIEQFARERGASEVDETMLDAAREHFGM